jgi:hypothetical protein
MSRIYVRIEAARKPGQAPTLAEEAATLRTAERIAEALGITKTPGEAARYGTLRGVTLRVDTEG